MKLEDTFTLHQKADEMRLEKMPLSTTCATRQQKLGRQCPNYNCAIHNCLKLVQYSLVYMLGSLSPIRTFTSLKAVATMYAIPEDLREDETMAIAPSMVEQSVGHSDP